MTRGFFFANEFSIFVDLPIDIHTAMVYSACNGNATSGATRPLRRVNMNQTSSTNLPLTLQEWSDKKAAESAALFGAKPRCEVWQLPSGYWAVRVDGTLLTASAQTLEE